MENSSQPLNESKLQHFPIAFFAMVMGCTGLALDWKKAIQVLGTPTWVAHALLILSGMLFLIISGTYLLKSMRFKPVVAAEFNHPLKLSFFPAISISLLLLSTATLSLHKQLSEILWFSGSLLHLTFTLYALGQWLHHPKYKIAHTTPAWFIPVVGNILVPIAGVEHGYTEVSWFFFSIGLVYWVILKTLIFNRLFFHDPLPEKLLPTLFILIAPPAVGFISYTKLNGELDNFARLLFYSALFLVLMLFSQFKRFSGILFYLSWWAYFFSLAVTFPPNLTP